MGVLFLIWLLAVEVFVVGIGALGHLVSRGEIAASALVRAGGMLTASVVGYIAVALLVGLILSPLGP